MLEATLVLAALASVGLVVLLATLLTPPVMIIARPGRAPARTRRGGADRFLVSRDALPPRVAEDPDAAQVVAVSLGPARPSDRRRAAPDQALEPAGRDRLRALRGRRPRSHCGHADGAMITARLPELA